MSRVNILVLTLVVFSLLPLAVKAQSAFLYLNPSKEDFSIGEEFSLSIKVNTGELPINAVKTVLYFPQDKLTILEISKENSIFSLWPEEPGFSNQSGEISFVGGMPYPGFTGRRGHLVSIKFQAKERGVAKISFGESAILASDGKGTNIFSYAQSSNYNLLYPAPLILSSTHSDEEKWYSNNNVELRWELANDITGVSFVLDKNPDSQPNKISQGRMNSKTYKEVKDGVWYFHLRIKDSKGWSSARHFVVHIDTIVPNSFEIAVNNEGDSTNPRPILYFDTNDEVSGIEYYRIEFETGDSIILANPGIKQYQLPVQTPGTHSILVQVFDRAGNVRENTTGVVVKPIEEPTIVIWPRIYTSGEERFYAEGEAIPRAEVTIFLERNENIVREWKVPVGNQGIWSFSSVELLESGVYDLFTRARDYRGALSELSPKKEVEIVFSGIVIGSLLITFRNLSLVLFIVLLALIIFAVYLLTKGAKHKKRLKIETKEAEEALHKGFDELSKEIKRELEKLEGVKSERELNQKEKGIIKNLREDLKEAEKYIGKEIKDIDKYL